MAETVSAKVEWARACSMMRSDLGRRACAEGWQTLLFDFLREHGRHPDFVEQNTLRAKAEAHAEERRGWRVAAALEAHQKRADRLERIAYGLE